MRGATQRWISILVGAVVTVLTLWLAYAMTEVRPKHDAIVDAAADAGGGGPVIAITAPTTITDSDAGSSLKFSGLFDGGLDSMPTGAPRTVHLGVVLVQFQGAEGASSSARNKKDALVEADKLAELAKTDFKKAVKGGDGGSGEDIGRIPRGVLDPRTEVAVFSLGANEIAGPLETPRGYWIVKRLE